MPHAVVNPSGTCERHGLIQVRLDFCLDKGDARYNDQRFRVDGAWLTERCFHHHFIYLDPYTLRDEQIEQAIALHLPNFYKAWVDERDKAQGGMRHGWDVATRQRPRRFDVKEPERYAERQALCLSKLPILAASSFATRVVGEGETFPSTDIDIGDAAIDRAGQASVYASPTYTTRVNGGNPANASGTVDTVEAWFVSASAGNSIKVGTFSAVEDTLTCRDAETIGEVAAGSKQTYTGLSIDVEAGDYIGADARAAYNVFFEFDSSGYTKLWSAIGQYCDPADSAAFTPLAEDAISLYGTGEPIPQTVSIDALLVDRTPSTLSIDAILKGPEYVSIDALLQDTDDASLTIDAILVDQSYSAPYYIEVRDPDGVLLGTIKDIITGSLEQETNMPDVLSLAIPLNEIRASLITRKNELWVRDSVTDTVLSICKLQIAEEVDG